MSYSFRCVECGTGRVKMRDVCGTLIGYKYILLPAPPGLKLKVCDRCGAEWLNEDDAERMDAAMEPVYQEYVKNGGVVHEHDTRRGFYSKKARQEAGSQDV